MPESALQNITRGIRGLTTRRDSDAERYESAGRLLLAALDAGAWKNDPTFLTLVRQRAEQSPLINGPISAWTEAVWILRGRPTDESELPFADQCELVAKTLIDSTDARDSSGSAIRAGQEFVKLFENDAELAKTAARAAAKVVVFGQIIAAINGDAETAAHLFGESVAQEIHKIRTETDEQRAAITVELRHELERADAAWRNEYGVEPPQNIEDYIRLGVRAGIDHEQIMSSQLGELMSHVEGFLLGKAPVDVEQLRDSIQCLLWFIKNEPVSIDEHREIGAALATIRKSRPEQIALPGKDSAVFLHSLKLAAIKSRRALSEEERFSLIRQLVEFQDELWAAGDPPKAAPNSLMQNQPHDRLQHNEPEVRPLTVPEAHQLVLELLRDPNTRTTRGLAAAIQAKGYQCSESQVRKTPAWKAFQAESKKRRASTPKAIRLSDSLEKTLGADDTELARLTGEQEADRRADEQQYRRRPKV